MFGGFPFQDFHSAGFGGQGPPKDVDTEKLYETLEVKKDATAKEIKKAYFRLSKIHHPDRGGDAHTFKEINAAYEILSDEEKRKKYDKYGLEGVSEDSVSSRAGGWPFSTEASGPKKGPPVNHPIKVSLEDVFNGKTVKLAVNRKVIDGEVKSCDACNGQGVKVEIRRMGPMIQQMQKTCSDCSGQGSIAKRKNQRKILEVHIEKGMKHHQKIKFRGMGDEIPNVEPGDINFIIEVQDHPLFQREGADLLVTKELSLNQALCGFSFKITHLDGRQVVVKSRPGEIIKPDAGSAGGKMIPFVKAIPGEGMPSLGNPFVKGNLYIVFRVVFPSDNELSDQQVELLKELLPDPDMEEDYNEEFAEEVHMAAADLRHFGRGGAESSGNAEYDSDDEGERNVQCQQS